MCAYLGYLRKIIAITFESSTRTAEWIETSITFLVFIGLIFKWIARHHFNENKKRTPQKTPAGLFWEWFSDDKIRVLVIIGLLIGAHISFVAPYKVYSDGVKELNLATNTLSLQLDTIISENESNKNLLYLFEEMGLRNHLTTSTNWARCSVDAFNEDNWDLSRRFFLMCTNDDPDTSEKHIEETHLLPIYYLDLLKMNAAQYPSRLPDEDAVKCFKQSLKEMTDSFYYAFVTGDNPHANGRTDPDRLSQNINFLNQVKESLQPLTQNPNASADATNLADFIQTVIDPINGLIATERRRK